MQRECTFSSVYPSNFKQAVHIQPVQMESQGVHLRLPHKQPAPLGGDRDLNFIKSKLFSLKTFKKKSSQSSSKLFTFF